MGLDRHRLELRLRRWTAASSLQAETAQELFGLAFWHGEADSLEAASKELNAP
jgi:hypothetical protein